jgi:hypothetical protein
MYAKMAALWGAAIVERMEYQLPGLISSQELTM